MTRILSASFHGRLDQEVDVTQQSHWPGNCRARLREFRGSPFTIYMTLFALGLVEPSGGIYSYISTTLCLRRAAYACWASQSGRGACRINLHL
ncbi:hypothetical protein BJX66DRAFT_263855 [Aspergillus keveii]|uniref:Uncharacterized protein n=1 Tax=Aspergillus keveii TaxID=714993 RepID=A0ABR4FZ14_9EURO